MEPTLTLITTIFSVGGVGYLIVTRILDASKRAQEEKQKEEDYERSQRVNKADWLSWLNAAKEEVNAAKEEAMVARRDAQRLSDEMVALISTHRQEIADRDALISRLQKQLNLQDEKIRQQALEIEGLRRELATWKSKAPLRRETIKEEAKSEVKEEIAQKLVD